MLLLLLDGLLIYGLRNIAILSVYNKTGLLDLAKGLSQNGVRLLASGGTAKLIREAGMPVQYVFWGGGGLMGWEGR